jgi:hypothetical protein
MYKGVVVYYEAGPVKGLSCIEGDVPACGLVGYMAGDFKNDVRDER